MPRALWKGSISFGLVNIPIELHTAVRNHRPKFRMLHAKDKSPVKFERVCIRDGHPVAWEDLVKGYEYAKGHFVVLTKEDFQAAALEKTRTVDIIDFVKAEEIDDRFFETPYYLVPAKGGERAYALLREAIRESGPHRHREVHPARRAAPRRRRSHQGRDRAVGDAVRRRARRRPAVRPAGQRRHPQGRSSRWRRRSSTASPRSGIPAKYTDEYRENLMRIIKAKVKGKKIHLEPAAEPRQAEVVDLMERLRRSLEQGGGKGRPRKPRSSAKPQRRRRRTAKKRAKSAA